MFPNNWFSTHPAGEAAGGVKKSTLVFYPMKCPNRAAERRKDIIEVGCGGLKGMGRRGRKEGCGCQRTYEESSLREQRSDALPQFVAGCLSV